MIWNCQPPFAVVVDDSAVVRKVLGNVLNSNSGTTLAGTASSGEAALSKIDDLKPDVVTLDIEMPGMDGLEALAEIRKRHPRLPVIMFSTLTESGGTATLEALALGANDYATKPTSSHNLASAKDHIERTLSVKSFLVTPDQRRAAQNSSHNCPTGHQKDPEAN